MTSGHHRLPIKTHFTLPGRYGRKGQDGQLIYPPYNATLIKGDRGDPGYPGRPGQPGIEGQYAQSL